MFTLVSKIEVTFVVSKVKGFLAGAHNTRRERTIAHGKLHFDVKAVRRLSLDERSAQPIVHLLNNGQVAVGKWDKQ